MKTIKIIALLVVVLFASCKKEETPSLYGTWLGVNHSTQFTIDNLEGKGKTNFILKGDQLTWKLNDSTTTVYKVVYIRQSTLTLNEKGVDKYFLRLD